MLERGEIIANNKEEVDEDTSEDSFIQLKVAKKASVSRSPIDGDDDDEDDEFEHGDIIAHAKDEDASDYSMHQFLAADDARGVEGADDGTQTEGENDDDGAEDEVEKSAAEADDNDFDSEDTPEEDSFIQLKAAKKVNVSRSPIDGDDDDDDDEFEHGDIIAHAKDDSMHQFLAADDARGVEGADDGTQAEGENDDDGAEDEVEKSAAEADDNDFDSEDTPEEDSFI